MGAGFALGDLGAIFGLCFAAGFDIFDWGFATIAGGFEPVFGVIVGEGVEEGEVEDVEEEEGVEEEGLGDDLWVGFGGALGDNFGGETVDLVLAFAGG